MRVVIYCRRGGGNKLHSLLVCIARYSVVVASHPSHVPLISPDVNFVVRFSAPLFSTNSPITTSASSAQSVNVNVR